MRQGTVGDARMVSKRESEWWVAMGAAVESRQHIGRESRGAVVKSLRQASKRGEEWAYDPFMWLSLYQDAWQMQRAGVVSLCSKPFNPFYLDRSDRLIREEERYARWLLGYDARRPAPASVMADHRVWAFARLTQAAVEDSDTLQLLYDAVSRPDHINRGAAIEALWSGASRGQWVAIEAFVQRLIEIARDWGDSSREDAIRALEQAAGTGHQMALDTLVEIAQDRRDSSRETAIKALREAADEGNEAAVGTLVAIALDPENSSREAAIGALGTAAHEGQEAAVIAEALAGIARNPADIEREAAISALMWFAWGGQQLAVDTLAGIALDKNDCSRGVAIRALRWPAQYGGHDTALDTLISIALDPDDPSREVAIDELGSIAMEGRRVHVGVETLVRIIKDRDDPSRNAAIRALDGAAGEGDELALQTLAGIARNPDNSYREAAVEELISAADAAMGGEQAALDILVEVAPDLDDSTREAVLKGIERIARSHYKKRLRPLAGDALRKIEGR